LLLEEAGDVGPVGGRRVILGESAKRLVRATTALQERDAEG
jgi:hypothetical protein